MRFMQGFDHGLVAAEDGYYTTNLWTATSTAGFKHVDLAGNGSAYSANVNVLLTHSFGVGDRWIHVAARSNTSNNATYDVVGVLKLGVHAAHVTWNGADGVVYIRRGNEGGTIIATSAAAAAPAGVWHWFWVDMQCKNSGGFIGVYLNGNPTALITFSGDTTAATTDDWDQLYFYGQTNRWFDDIVTYTDTEKSAFANGVYPELFIPVIVPTSDNVNTFVSGGFAAVDEIPWSTADYAESTSAGQELILNVTGLAWTPNAVRGVGVSSLVARDGVINQFGGILKSSTTQITVKQSCRVATNAALPAYTAAGTGPGKTLTANAVGVLTVDGVATVLNNRVLVKEGTAVDNGIYKCTTEGTAGVAFVLTRATDFDNVGPDAEVDTGDVTYITEGTANGNKTFRLSTADPITVDTTALTFAEMAAYLPSKAGVGAGTYVHGEWLFALDPNGDIQWTYANVQAAKPGVQTQTAL